MKLFLSDTNKLLRIPDSDKIMLGDECCCEWIAYKFIQEGFYDCEREGDEFTYNDPSSFCGTPFEFTTTARSLIRKMNYEACPYCGGTLQPDTSDTIMWQKGSLTISLFLINSMTITITPSSYFNYCHLGVVGSPPDTYTVQGHRNFYLDGLGLASVCSDGVTTTKIVRGHHDTTITKISCDDMSTNIYWDSETPPIPWEITFNSGLHTIVLETSGIWASGDSFAIKETIVTDDDWDMFSVDFSRDIPNERTV